MDIQKREELKEGVLRFLRTKDGYNPDFLDEVSIQGGIGSYTILYGKSLETGIFGHGNSMEDAFLDFSRKWNSFNGFEWIQRANASV